MITRMVCTTAMLDRQNRDLRQRAGAAGEEGRGAVPAVDALEVIARAEGRAESRERQQPDGQRIGADLLDQMPRNDGAQRNAEQHQHGLGQEWRHRKLASGNRGASDRDHRARDQPARKPRGQEGQSARGADDERLRSAQNLGTAQPFE
jgi:hypothetical protein